MHVTTITDTQIMAESTKSCNSDVVKALHAHLRDEVNSGEIIILINFIIYLFLCRARFR